jgi:hypothetical protein
VPDNKEIEYMRCFNCGKFIITEDAYKEKYCSLICSSVYAKCSNCGTFYEAKKGYSENYCSCECSTAHEIPNSEIKHTEKSTQ